MYMETRKEPKMYNRNIIFGLFIPLIFIGKIVRYTLMKSILVDVGIGHEWISKILYDTLKFSLFSSESVTETRGNAVTFYQRINFFNIDSYVNWEIYISIIFNILMLFVLLKVKKKLNFMQFLFICLSIIVLNIFDFCLAKEPVQMLYFLFIFIVLINKKINVKLKYVLSVLIIIFSAATLRNYYILMAFFMVISTIIINIIILKKDKIKMKDIILILLILGLCFYLILKTAQIISPDDYNELIRVRNRTSSANTDIRNWIKSSNLIIFSLNYLITIIRLVFPVELITLGPKYIPYVLYQIFISYFLICNLKNKKRNNKIKNIVLYIYCGFLLGSVTFEPDFGSWVRHEAILFPLLLLNCDAIEIKEKIGEKNEI